MMTPQQIKTALKINQIAAEREAEFESIAETLGLDIDRIALELVSAPSPTGRRQVVRRINKGSKQGSVQGDAPSFSKLSMMKIPFNSGANSAGRVITKQQSQLEQQKAPVSAPHALKKAESATH